MKCLYVYKRFKECSVITPVRITFIVFNINLQNAKVNEVIGPIARPDKIQIVFGLPKTRSGKIMRRILRKIAEGELNQIGDTTTLLDPMVVEDIKKGRL